MTTKRNHPAYNKKLLLQQKYQKREYYNKVVKTSFFAVD
jgi:hypothetical protein